MQVPFLKSCSYIVYDDPALSIAMQHQSLNIRKAMSWIDTENKQKILPLVTKLAGMVQRRKEMLCFSIFMFQCNLNLTSQTGCGISSHIELKVNKATISSIVLSN